MSFIIKIGPNAHSMLKLKRRVFSDPHVCDLINLLWALGMLYGCYKNHYGVNGNKSDISPIGQGEMFL